MYQENSTIYFLKKKCPFSHMVSQHDPITANWHLYTNLGLRAMKNYMTIVFCEHKTGIHYHLTTQIKCECFIKDGNLYFSYQSSFLRLPIVSYYCFVKEAPPKPMLLDLLQIFLAFGWGLILWTWLDYKLLVIPHYHYGPSSSHKKRHCYVLLMLAMLLLHPLDEPFWLYFFSSCIWIIFPRLRLFFLHWREIEDLLPLSRSSSFFVQTFKGQVLTKSLLSSFFFAPV